MEEMRLQKFLAEAGIASRRKCEKLIEEGRVKVNSKTAILGMKINPVKDEIYFDGKIVKIEEEKVYILLNKPIGYVTTISDEFERKTVMDLVNVEKRIVPVGRLDMNTSGALILSNDGDFIYKITHPKHEITKTYIALVDGKVSEEALNCFRKGIKIEDYITSPATAEIIKYDKEKDQTELKIVIHEGKNRQVRKMLEAIGKKTLKLHRSQISDLGVKDLKLGSWRYLEKQEVDKLLK